jgi:4-hydroxyacetophenone monooxygenase
VPSAVPEADVARFREAVAQASIPTLLPVLVQLTGEDRWLEERYRPERTRGLADNPTGGLPEDVQREIRDAALEAILAWRAGRPVAIPEPQYPLAVQLLSFSMGEDVPSEYGPMIAEELRIGLHPEEGRAPRLDVPDGFRALIVGAGISGLTAAIKFEEAGIPYIVLERRETVGGTWLDNRYPGCGVDTPSALYSFSFAQYDWSRYFALRDELHGYLEDLVDEFGLRDRIRFGTEVVAAAYDEDAQEWEVTTDAGETLRANVLITAVGAFNKPKFPRIPGLHDFAGPVVHTARWPEDLDLAGKRVAVIGNGASGMQLVPAIAGTAASITIFQRSPQWAAPFELLHVKVPEPLRWLSEEVPLYRLWYRLRQGWTFNDRIHEALQKDPEWDHPDRSVNAINDAHRRFFIRYIESELGDRPDLMEKVLPDYPPYGKRILLDNGWYRTLKRDDVELVTDSIARVEGNRVVTETGESYEVDVIACATGFDVVRFLAPIEITGRDGARLHDVWDDDDARAFLGTAVPGFPNLLMVYGPNTQGGHGGSLIGTGEAQLHYIVSLLGQMVHNGIGAVEVKPGVYEDYNRKVDEAHEAMIWTHPGMDTYYRNARGRVVVPIPWRVVDFWHMTRVADLDDFVVEPAVAAVR